jgi:hypothetical protein
MRCEEKVCGYKKVQVLSELDVVGRRLELLKLEGLGFSRAEIVKELCVKASCSKRTVYNDFETRASWQPALLSVGNPKEIALKIMNRYEQIYRQASRRLFTSANEFVQICALNVMVKVNSLVLEGLVLPEVIGRLKALERKTAKGVFVQ